MSEAPPAGASPPAARRGFGPGALILVALLSAAVAIIATRWLVQRAHLDDRAGGADGELATMYQCPMHPSIIQDHPGDCPICGMRLVAMHPPKPGGQPAASAARAVLFYRSPMDPRQTSPTPRKDEMGMDYVAVYEGEPAAGAVPGLATVEIDPAHQQLIGLTTALVSRGPIGGAWRTIGRVAVDETRVRHVNLKVSGFVDRVFVDFVGKKVKRGDALFSMYSPELLAAQEEYLLALRTSRSLASSAGGAAGGDGDVLVAAARRKLALWDVSAATLARLARTGEPTKNLMFYSPAAGVVTKKDVVEGMKLDAGAMPYEIVDLSSVWVLADVYESELRFVSEGMTGTLELAAFPDRQFHGKVIFVDPMLDPQTRTVKVRLAFANPLGELRPELFGEVVLHGPARDALRMPLDAVVDSGTRKIVMVAIGAGKFEPREVELGTNDGADVEVLRGVSAGERVVTRANFLVDSESRLRASLADRFAPATGPERARVLPDPPAPSPPAPGPAEPRP